MNKPSYELNIKNSLLLNDLQAELYIKHLLDFLSQGNYEKSSI